MLNNQIFLESWFSYNIPAYKKLATMLFNSIDSKDELSCRCGFLELFKIQNEIIETICMWYEVLKQSSKNQNLKLFFALSNTDIKKDSFSKLFEYLKTITSYQFKDELGFSNDIDFKQYFPGSMVSLFEEIKTTFQTLVESKVDDNHTFLYMYNKIKHGNIVFVDENTSKFNISILLIDRKDCNAIIDQVEILADYSLCEHMYNSIVNVSTQLLYTLLRLKQVDMISKNQN